MLGAFVNDGGFTQINDGLAKRDDYIPEGYYFIPVLYTVNHDHAHDEGSNPSNVIEGAQFGMPFQGALGGIVMNATMGEEAGVEFPSDGWTYAEAFLDGARKASDPDTDLWGTWARNDYEFQWWAPMCFGAGGLAYRNADETGLAVFDNGGDWGLKFDVGLIHEEQVSFPDSEAKRVAGEFGNAFASGKVWSWLGGRVYPSGFDVPRIKDRFRWSLGPMPIGPIGEERHSWNDQPNLITNGAERRSISGVPDSGRPGRTQVPDRRPGSTGGRQSPVGGDFSLTNRRSLPMMSPCPAMQTASGRQPWAHQPGLRTLTSEDLRESVKLQFCRPNGDQAITGAWRMPWRQKPKKGAAGCDKPRGAASRL